MKQKSWLPIAIVVCFVLLVAAPAKSSTHEFYKDKTIRFVVGFAPGGGYDLAARIVGRHMGRHIPGNPTIVVENMKDSEFLADAQKTKFEVTYVSGEEVEKRVEGMLAITPKAKELLDFLMVKPKS